MRIIVYVRLETLIPLLMKKGWTQAILAGRIGVSDWYVSMVINRKMSPSPKVQSRILEAFKGMSVEPGGRLSWDRLFRTELVDTNGTHI